MSNHFYRESLRARIRELQSQLEAKNGPIRGFSLTLDPTKETCFENIAEDVIHLLECMLEGKMVEHKPIGDSHRPVIGFDPDDTFLPHP